MQVKVNQFVDLFPDFHDLPETEQITRLVYFFTEMEGHETISREELERLFKFASLPVPKNLPQLLAYLCRKGKRLLQEASEYKVRHEVAKRTQAEVRRRLGKPLRLAETTGTPFEFSQKTFKDRKIETLLRELAACYKQACWNACGILMRIIIERALDSVDQSVKNKQGLKAKLNYCISANSLFSKSVREALQHLQGAKIVGDIAAHHSSILLERTDIDIPLQHFRMLIKEVSTI